MNWNSYDTKYIIKKLIVGLGMLISFCILTTRKASALEFKNYSFPANNSFVTTTAIQENTWNISDTTQWGGSTGWLYFQLYSVPYVSGGTSYPVLQLQSVRITTGGNAYTCKLGNMLTYADSTNAIIGYNVECPINGNVTSLYVKFMGVTGNNNYAVLYSSSYGTFYDSQISLNTDGVSQQQFNAFQQQLRDDFASIVTSMQSSINNNSAKSAVEALQVQQQQQAQQAHQDSQEIKNTITNDNVDGANGDLDNFKNSSTFSDTTGLQAVIELPLNLVNSFTNTCQPISITIPWLDYTGTIPCMSTIYRQHFNSLYSVVAVIVNAFFVYRILLKIYEIVHNAKQPDEDKLEVIDL